MKRFFAIILIMTLGMSVCGCSEHSGKEYLYHSTLSFFNTDLSVRVFADRAKDGAKVKELFEQDMAQVARQTESLMSVMVEGSDIYRYNQAGVGERIKIDPLTAEILNEALEIYRLTGGSYNPAVAMLVDLWGFSPRFIDYRYYGITKPYDRTKPGGEYASLPDTEYINAFKSLTDLSGFEVEETDKGEFFITKTCPSVTVRGEIYTQALDLGGIAKGYVADRCGEILAENGFKYGMVSLGGSSFSLQSFFDTDVMEEGKWKISVASPKNRQSVFYFKGSDCGISTSGTYENHYYIGGKEYGHIIAAESGAPIDNGIKSVTLCGIDAMEGDALSTALCVMGLNKATEFVAEHLTRCYVVILTEDGDKFKAYTNVPAKNYGYESSQISQVIAI